MNAETDTPDIRTDQEDGDGEPMLYVSAGIHTGSQAFNANAVLDVDSTPDQVADVLLRAALAAAAMHHTDTWMALQHRLNSGGA